MFVKKLAALLTVLGALSFISPQPAKALDFYLDADVGGFNPSDSQIQKVYGLMPQLEVGLGIESNGWGGELGVIGSFGSKTTDFSIPGLTQESNLTNLEFAARFQKAFGKPGESIRPYLGLQASYVYSGEEAKVEYYGIELGDASISATGGGFGIFGGVDFPLTKKLLLNLKVMYDYTQVSGKVDSTNNLIVTARSGVNSGGFSIVGGLKYFF